MKYHLNQIAYTKADQYSFIILPILEKENILYSYLFQWDRSTREYYFGSDYEIRTKKECRDIAMESNEEISQIQKLCLDELFSYGIQK